METLIALLFLLPVGLLTVLTLAAFALRRSAPYPSRRLAADAEQLLPRAAAAPVAPFRLPSDALFTRRGA